MQGNLRFFGEQAGFRCFFCLLPPRAILPILLASGADSPFHPPRKRSQPHNQSLSFGPHSPASPLRSRPSKEKRNWPTLAGLCPTAPSTQCARSGAQPGAGKASLRLVSCGGQSCQRFVAIGLPPTVCCQRFDAYLPTPRTCGVCLPPPFHANMPPLPQTWSSALV